MICKNCGSVMKHSLSFEDGKAYEFYQCPKCYSRTKNAPYDFASIDNNIDIKSKQNNKRQNKYKKRRK